MDLQVDAVGQRAGNLALIPFNIERTEGTFFCLVTKKSTGTRILVTLQTKDAGNYSLKSPVESRFYGAVFFSKIIDLIYL